MSVCPPGSQPGYKYSMTTTGQTTLTAAFIDDIFTLGTLVMMTSLAKGETSPMNIVRLAGCSLGFLAASVFLAVKVFPYLPRLLARIPGSR